MARGGSQLAIIRLVEFCARWIEFEATRNARFSGVPVDELRQEGRLAVLRAIESFEPGKAQFSTYAILWIRAYVRRYASHQRNPLKIRKVTLLTVTRDARELEAIPEQRDGLDVDLDRQRARCRVREAVAEFGSRLSDHDRVIMRQRWLSEDVTALDRLGLSLGTARESIRKRELELFARFSAYARAIGLAEVA